MLTELLILVSSQAYTGPNPRSLHLLIPYRSIDLKIDNIALSSYYSDTELDQIVESDKPQYYPSQDVFGKHVQPLISQPLPFPEKIPNNGYYFKLADFGHCIDTLIHLFAIVY